MKRITLLFVLTVGISLPAFSQDPPLPPEDGAKQISGGVLNGKAVALPKPAYPRAAMMVRASGAVSVQVLIDESGNVISAAAVAGHPLLRAAAIEAAKRAQFSPTKLEGQPVKVSGIITYNFVADDRPEKAILGLGYHLADGQSTNSLDLHAVERDMPASWTEERSLLGKISAAARKYTEENPPKIEPEKKAATPAKAIVENKSSTGTLPPRDVNPAPQSYRGPVGVDRFTIVGTSSPWPGSVVSIVRVGPETVEDIAELQSVILLRFAASDSVLWYFKCGQALARVKAYAADESRSALAVEELRELSLQLAPTDKRRTQLEEIIKLAELVRNDPAKKLDLENMITGMRNNL